MTQVHFWADFNVRSRIPLLGFLSVIILFLSACTSKSQSGLSNRKSNLTDDPSCGENDAESGKALRLADAEDDSEDEEEEEEEDSDSCPKERVPERSNRSTSTGTKTATSTHTATRTMTSTMTSTATSTGTENSPGALLFKNKCEGGACHAAAGRGLENTPEQDITQALRAVRVMRNIQITPDEVKAVAEFLKKP